MLKDFNILLSLRILKGTLCACKLIFSAFVRQLLVFSEFWGTLSQSSCWPVAKWGTPSTSFSPAWRLSTFSSSSSQLLTTPSLEASLLNYLIWAGRRRKLRKSAEKQYNESYFAASHINHTRTLGWQIGQLRGWREQFTQFIGPISRSQMSFNCRDSQIFLTSSSSSSLYCKNHIKTLIKIFSHRVLLAIWPRQWNLCYPVSEVPLSNQQYHLQRINLSYHCDCLRKVNLIKYKDILFFWPTVN